MEFGKLESVDDINWTLPPNDPISVRFLQSLPASSELKIHYGAPAWSHKEWIGSIYPPKTKAADYLYHYSRYFDCIELNTSHYRIPTQEQTKKWVDQTPSGFKFCSKIPQDISHSLHGLGDKTLLKEWLNYLNYLGDRQGPSFIQLPPHFDYSKKTLLFHFLQNWPEDFPLSLELRHPSWFQDHKILPALTEYLQKRKIGLVLTDVAGRRDVVHTSISTDYILLRFIGNSLHPSDEVRMKDWAVRLQEWQKQGLKEVFYFLHQPEDLLTPQASELFVKIYSEFKEFHLSHCSSPALFV